MKKKLRIILLAQLTHLLFAVQVDGQFYTLETNNLRLLYLGIEHEYVVPHLARCFENSMRFHSNLFNYSLNEKVTVFLQDFSDYHNGGATPVPTNFIQLNLAPAKYVFETAPANERMNHTMSHELVHIVTTDQASSSDEFFRSVFFGKVQASKKNPISIFYQYLTNPRWLSPRWYIEGIAVFLETYMAGGIGRANGAYDEMVFRSIVRDGGYIYDVVGLEAEGTAIDFQVGANSYLYGTRFISYITYQYGPEKLIEWFSRTKGSKRYFASQFRNVYGSALDDEWSRWITWERAWQQANLDSIRLNPVTNFRTISQRALGSISRTYYDTNNGKLYAAVRYPGQVAHIAAIDVNSGEINKICDVKGASLHSVSSLTYDPTEELLYYTTDNNRFRDLNVVNIRTHKSKRLITDVRTGDLTFNQVDKSIWGVRHYNGLSTLVRIPYPYREGHQIYTFPYGQDIFDIDIAPDGSIITAAFVDIAANQKLIKMNVAKLLEGETSYDVLYDFEFSVPANFVFSPDGRYLLGSSYRSGVSNIYRYDFEEEDMNILSNCESGLFRPVYFSEDSLVCMRYTGQGFIPVVIENNPLEHVKRIKFLGTEIPKKHPIVKKWILGSPASINLDSLITSEGRYYSLRNLRLNSAYPIIEGYKDFAAIGMQIDFSDYLGLSGFEMSASYSPNQSLPWNEITHINAIFHHWQWKISASYNLADFYDLFGQTKRSRKGYSLGVQYKKTLLYDEPKSLDLTFDIEGFAGLERLPYYQNVATTYEELLTASIGLNYQFVRKSLGAVDDEKGIIWSLMTMDNYVKSQHIISMFTNFDYGILLPINHSSIWLRSSFGHSFGKLNDPFANFFFGGFGNNWIDKLTEKRYREFYSFPGVEINEFGGKYYGKVMFEWNSPPVRFRRLGFPSLYCNWARSAIFTSLIALNFDEQAANLPYPQYGVKRIVSNVGSQVDFRLVLFSHFKSTFSLGYALAFEQNQSLSTEFMISLKIM